MNIVVTQTAINASVSDQNISTSLTQTPISVSATISNVSASLTQTQINSSVQQGSGVSISLYQSPINVTVSSGGGGGISDAPFDSLLYGRRNGAWTNITGTGGGSSLPVADTQTIVMGSVDPTKLLRFEVDGFTAGATRVLTPPNQNATIAGLEVANVFTTTQRINVPTTSLVGLTIQTTDNNETNPAWRLLNASGTSIANLEADGILKLNHGFSLPAFDVFAPDFAIKVVRQSDPTTSTGLYFQNKQDSGYAEFTLLNNIETIFAMGIGGDGEPTGYDNVGYIYISSSGQFITLDATTSGQYIQFQTAAGVTMKVTEGGLSLNVIKSGATQVAAGAAAGEVWKTNGHATLPNNVLMIGV